MTTYNLKPMDSHKSFYGKAKVEERDDGSKVLYSYGTPVCGLTVSGRFFRAWGGYSATTMRHVNSFLEAEGMNGGGKAWWDKQPVVEGGDLPALSFCFGLEWLASPIFRL